MFHKHSGKQHQFIRTTYDSKTKRSTQKVVLKFSVTHDHKNHPINTSALNDQEKSYFNDWLQTKIATEKAEADERMSKAMGKTLHGVCAAIKNYPCTGENLREAFKASKKLCKLLGEQLRLEEQATEAIAKEFDKNIVQG